MTSQNTCKWDVLYFQATSKLLVNYKEPYRSQILDYLFKVCILLFSMLMLILI